MLSYGLHTLRYQKEQRRTFPCWKEVVCLDHRLGTTHYANHQELGILSHPSMPADPLLGYRFGVLPLPLCPRALVWVERWGFSLCRLWSNYLSKEIVLQLLVGYSPNMNRNLQAWIQSTRFLTEAEFCHCSRENFRLLALCFTVSLCSYLSHSLTRSMNDSLAILVGLDCLCLSLSFHVRIRCVLLMPLLLVIHYRELSNWTAFDKIFHTSNYVIVRNTTIF